MTAAARRVKLICLEAGAVLALLTVLCAVLACSGGNLEKTPHSTPMQTSAPSQREPASPGVSDDAIRFGQSAAFSGPAEELGLNMQLGILAAFEEVNRRGGVHNRRLILTSLDDSYEPEAAIANTGKLIKEENVFALIGAVGTPTSRSAAPVAANAGVPYIAPFTGADLLRSEGLLTEEQLKNVINLRSSYKQETEEMVERLTSDLGIERIAVMYQDDSFGLAGYVGVIEALERRGMKPVSIGWYPRNTTSVKRGLLDVRAGSPEAVIIIGAYQPVGAMISWARHTGLDVVFMTVSFVGSNALAENLGSGGAGVVVTQVVPFPTGDAFPALESYRRALAAYKPGAEPGFVSLEGYLAGRLAIFGLERCGPDVDRACFMEAIRGAGKFAIDGFPLRYGDGDNQGSDAVFLTIIDQDGEYRPVESLAELQLLTARRE